MDSKELLLLVACLLLLGELRLTSTTTTTTFVAAMSIANQDLERYFRTTNASQTLAAMTEERIAMDMYTYAYLNYSYLNEQHRFVQIKYDEEKARYGEGRVLEPRGKLVHISDINAADNRTSGTDFACSSNIRGTNGDPTPEPGIMWIALVRRGRCTFEEKVMHVHAKGAAGVIIYNDKPVTNLEKMQIKGKSRNITAVITYHDIGLNMTQILDQGFDVTAAIIEGRSGMRPIHTMNRTSVLFVSISFIVLMIISLVWLVFYYIQRFRYLQTKDQQSRHLCSVTKKAIMKIPTKTGKVSDEKDADSDCCAICIEAYKPSDCIRVLPCKHEFHKNCIDPWLIEHRTCPMCKLDVLKFYGYVFIDSEESILEYEAERSGSVATTATATVAQPSAVVAETQSRLADMIRSRDFVIDFPRVFVLDASSTTRTQETLFPENMPERSQSSLTLANAKDWMSQMSNKLEEQQHGLRRVRKNSARCELQENLLDVRCNSAKKRRSRSADGRYSNSGGLERQSRTATRGTVADGDLAVAEDVCLTVMPQHTSRRSSSALRILTDASYAQSIQRRREELMQQARRRLSAVPLPTQPHGQSRSSTSAERGDVAVQILLNGEGFDF